VETGQDNRNPALLDRRDAPAVLALCLRDTHSLRPWQAFNPGLKV